MGSSAYAATAKLLESNQICQGKRSTSSPLVQALSRQKKGKRQIRED